MPRRCLPLSFVDAGGCLLCCHRVLLYIFARVYFLFGGLTIYRLKLKRQQAAKAFRSQIDDMYAEIRSQPAVKAKL